MLVAMAMVFVAVVAFDFLVHGFLLTGEYEKTKCLWRPQAEYKVSAMMTAQLFFSVFTVLMVSLVTKGTQKMPGMVFGLIFGLLLSSIELGKYGYMAVPCHLVCYWMLASFCKGFGVCAIATLKYKK